MWWRWSLPGLARTRATPRLEQRWRPCGLAVALTGEEEATALAVASEEHATAWVRESSSSCATVRQLDLKEHIEISPHTIAYCLLWNIHLACTLN